GARRAGQSGNARDDAGGGRGATRLVEAANCHDSLRLTLFRDVFLIFGKSSTEPFRASLPRRRHRSAQTRINLDRRRRRLIRKEKSTELRGSASLTEC
ncbi:hypothetical protein, partial [Paraburkholderia tropica]|uniref:hypothetical protein n=1 Tax=Paraburkholderia tropica TaxID=92647 RepID=UPI001CC5DCDB